MSKKWPGGIITPTPVTPTGPYQNGSASGIWTIMQMDYWLQQGLWPIAGNAPPTAVFAGGNSSSLMQYVYIATTGNASTFGNLTQAMNGCAGSGSSTRGVIASSYVSGYSNVINYITISSPGDATYFGDLTNRRQLAGSFSNSTRACWAGGDSVSGGDVNIIDYITIATTGNATDFGDQTVTGAYMAGCASPTRGIWAGAFEGGASNQFNTINYVTIATTGNATVFGYLSVPHGQFRPAAASSSTRGIFAGGRNNAAGATTSVMDYVTIASTGNATNFGNLTVATIGPTGTSSSTRALFAGGDYNNIGYVTIATTGNATAFGELSNLAKYNSASTSNAHGGL